MQQKKKQTPRSDAHHLIPADHHYGVHQRLRLFVRPSVRPSVAGVGLHSGSRGESNHSSLFKVDRHMYIYTHVVMSELLDGKERKRKETTNPEMKWKKKRNAPICIYVYVYVSTARRGGGVGVEMI